jgi:hypothetical protein
MDIEQNGQHRIIFRDIVALKPKDPTKNERIEALAKVAACLPDHHWDRLSVFVDVIVNSVLYPGAKLDDQYEYLRDVFMRDTGMADILPDFVEDCSDLSSLCRYLNRMGVTINQQVFHVHEAFEPLIEFMELVYRPRTTNYHREYWPQQPKTTPFAKLPPIDEQASDSSIDSTQWTGRYTLADHAKRILTLGPLAIMGLERLINELDQKRSDNLPPELLFPEELDGLRRLHRELGELIKMARAGHLLDDQLSVVRNLVNKTFCVLKSTGELSISGIQLVAASALPAWGTLKVCETLLGMSGEASATVAAGVIAGGFALHHPKNSDGSGTNSK